MLYLLPLLVMISVILATLAIASIFSEKSQFVLRRITGDHGQAKPANIRQMEMEQPFRERVLKPLFRVFASWTKGRLLAKRHKYWQRLLQQAGRTGELELGVFVGRKLVLALGAVVVAVTGAHLSGEWSSKYVLLVMLAAAAGWYGPEFFLKQRIKSRQEAVRRSLPDVLDLITVSVEAGLAFDAAMARVSEKWQGPLAAEFRRVIHEISVGKPRRDALRDMANRVGVAELHGFVTAVIQAEQLGIGMANMLRHHAHQLRQRRRQQVEERAMQVPIKMLIPLILFIFPSIFIVLLGPAVIQILHVLGRK